MDSGDLPNTGQPPSLLDGIAVGQILDDFELVQLLSTTTGSKTFLARQRSMQRMVALEVVPHDGRPLTDFAQIEHPYVARVFDRRISDDGMLQLTHRQHLAGGSLRELLKEMSKQPDGWTGAALVEYLRQAASGEVSTDSIQRQRLTALSWSETVGLLGEQIADALAQARQHELTHPQLTTDHVWLTETGIPKVLGFTQRTAGGDGDQREIEALGRMLSQLLAGQAGPKFDPGASQAQAPPTALHHVLHRAVAGDADERPSSMEQMALQLTVCTNDASARLLMPPRETRRKIAISAPLAVSLLTLMIPNVLAGIFNYLYNHELIVVPLNASSEFGWVMTVINAIAYPAGILLAVVVLWDVSREVKQRGESYHSAAASEKMRAACLLVPHRFGILGICLWCLAGAAYPLALRGAGAPLSGWDAAHFFCSLVMCGLIGATYPFIGAAAMVVSVWYPALLRPDLPSAEDVRGLSRLESAAPVYLVLAGSVPLLGLASLALFDQTGRRLLLGILSLGGAAFLVAAFFVWNRTAGDIKTLKKITSRK